MLASREESQGRSIIDVLASREERSIIGWQRKNVIMHPHPTTTTALPPTKEKANPLQDFMCWLNRTGQKFGNEMQIPIPTSRHVQNPT